jgi:hypothetical protein
MKPTLLCAFSLLLAFASMPVQADTTTATPDEVRDAVNEDPADGLSCADHTDALDAIGYFETDTFLAVYDLEIKPASVGVYGPDLLDHLFGDVVSLKPREGHVSA